MSVVGRLESDKHSLALKEIVAETGVEITKLSKVFIARDTRPSGLSFTKGLMDGIQAMGGLYHDFGKCKLSV